MADKMCTKGRLDMWENYCKAVLGVADLSENPEELYRSIINKTICLWSHVCWTSVTDLTRILTRQEMQRTNHMNHKEAGLARQISTVGFILQEIEADITIQHVRTAKDLCLKVKLMNQRGRIRKYRCEPHHPAHSLRRGRDRSPVASKGNVETLWRQWKADRLTAVDTNEYLDQETARARHDQ